MNSRGFSLIELMMSSGVSVIIGLALLATLNFAVDRLNVVMEQVKAEENLALAASQLSKYLSQAVKIRCCRGAGCGAPGNPATGGVLAGIPHPTYNQVVIAGEPVGIADGVVDCRVGTATAYPGARQNALALFTREVGSPLPNGAAYSQYRGAAIYFVPAFQDAGSGSSQIGDNSGRVEFFDSPPGQPFDRTSFHDRLVWVGVNETAPGSGIPQVDDDTPLGYLRSISFRLTSRYFEQTARAGVYHYRQAIPTVQHRDIFTNVTVLFKNNRIDMSALNGNTSERPLGQLYFFRLFTPSVGGRE